VRNKDQDALNLPFYISVQELFKGLIAYILDLPPDEHFDYFKADSYPNRQR